MPTIGEGIADAGRFIASGITARGDRNRRREEDERRAEQERKEREDENRAIADEYGVHPTRVKLLRAQGRTTPEIHRFFSKERDKKQGRTAGLKKKASDLGIPFDRPDLSGKPKSAKDQFALKLKGSRQRPTSLPKETDKGLAQEQERRRGNAENEAIAKRYGVSVAVIERMRDEGRTTTQIHADLKPDEATGGEKGRTALGQRSDKIANIKSLTEDTKGNERLRNVYRLAAEDRLPWEIYRQQFVGVEQPEELKKVLTEKQKELAENIKQVEEFLPGKAKTSDKVSTLRKQWNARIEKIIDDLIASQGRRQVRDVITEFPDTRSGIDQQDAAQAQAINAQADNLDQLTEALRQQIEQLNARLQRIGL